MNRRYVETKVLAQHGPSTHLLIKAGDTVVQANYAEVAPCAFPVWTGAPVYVEIPAHGVKNSVPGSFSRAPEPQDASGELPNIIKFPVYTHQEETALQEFEDLAGPSGRSNGATGPGSRHQPSTGVTTKP
ncbi:MAG TPA: hypothetical protein PK112_08025, partial [candidate division Zixibacteria bacterium]|nr:hypothetical protein [candidate division Zixibacteria bacterium]